MGTTSFTSSSHPMFGLCLQAKSLTGLVNQLVADVESAQAPAEVAAAAHVAYDAIKRVDMLLADQAVAAGGARLHYSALARDAQAGAA